MNARRVTVLAVALLSLCASVPAHAANAGVVEVVGEAWVSPGLGLVPELQTIAISITNSPTVAASGGLGADDCDFSGSGLADSIEEGVGVLSGACSGRWNASFSTCVYVRVGLAMSIVCAGVIDAAYAELVLTPTALLPTQHFTAIGVLAVAQ